MDLWITALQEVMQIEYLLILGIGTLAGIMLGIVPGIGPVQGVAVALPFTYGLDALGAIILLGALYSASMYGGQVTSILIGTPGDPAHAMTVLDGYPMSKQGRAGIAIGAATAASLGSALVGVLALSFASPLIANVAIRLGPPELFVIN